MWALEMSGQKDSMMRKIKKWGKGRGKESETRATGLGKGGTYDFTRKERAQT